MNHKEGDKGLGPPKGKMTNDQILQWYLPKKIWNFKLAIIQAAGKTSSGGNTGYWTTFSVNNSEGLWDLRKGQSRFRWWKTRTSGYALSYDDDDPLDQETDPGPLGLWGSAAKIILTTVGREHYPHDIQWPEEKEKWQLGWWSMMATHPIWRPVNVQCSCEEFYSNKFSWFHLVRLFSIVAGEPISY